MGDCSQLSFRSHHTLSTRNLFSKEGRNRGRRFGRTHLRLRAKKTRFFQVIVIEGHGHPGGRVHTFREGFAPGLTGETGATRIPDTHALTHRPIRDLLSQGRGPVTISLA